MQWRESDQKPLLSVDIADRVAIVGYQGVTSTVTVRLVDAESDQKYMSLLEDCNADAERSPVVGTLQKDHKVWARLSGQWYRGKVDSVSYNQTVTVNLMDLGRVEEVAKENLRLLQSKDLFFRPAVTRSFRLKGLRQKDIFSSMAVRNRIEQAIAKKDLFTVTDNANNYIDLQIDGTPKSFNYTLLTLYERQTGLEEEALAAPPAAALEATRTTTTVTQGGGTLTAPSFSVDSISYPAYDAELTTPPLYVFECAFDGLSWVLSAFHMKHMEEMRTLSLQIKGSGKALFKATEAPTGYGDLDLNQLCLINIEGEKYDRCSFRGDGAFESIDVGKRYEDVALRQVRVLPRELISQSYLMVLLLDDDYVEDMGAMTQLLQGLRNRPVNSIDRVIHMGGNNFKCIWKKAA